MKKNLAYKDYGNLRSYYYPTEEALILTANHDFTKVETLKNEITAIFETPKIGITQIPYLYKEFEQSTFIISFSGNYGSDTTNSKIKCLDKKKSNIDKLKNNYK